MSSRTRKPSGTGRGTQTNDGCSVELYRLTPYRGELEGIVTWLEGRKVLELGCGTGRLTRRLLELGCTVTAIDDSEDMLSSVPTTATALHSGIEELRIESDFEIALLASYIFNNPDRAARPRLIDAARRHVKPDGKFVLQVHNERILTHIDEKRTTSADGITSRISNYQKEGAIVSMTIHYSIGSDEWTHSFQTQFLSMDEIADELIQAGFSKLEWADESQGWLAAE